jgi:hypothetical protein
MYAVTRQNVRASHYLDNLGGMQRTRFTESASRSRASAQDVQCDNTNRQQALAAHGDPLGLEPSARTLPFVTDVKPDIVLAWVYYYANVRTCPVYRVYWEKHRIAGSIAPVRETSAVGQERALISTIAAELAQRVEET